MMDDGDEDIESMEREKSRNGFPDDKEPVAAAIMEALLRYRGINTTSQLAIIGANVCPIESLDYDWAASKHSRASTNAYKRGDHVSAHKLSLMARNLRTDVELLNANAAAEILRIKNHNNGTWKLDLHGIHATEAVGALQDYLNMIESQTSKEKWLLPNQSTTLLVITGIVKHSHGPPTLPPEV